jgi:hypothetical protein
LGCGADGRQRNRNGKGKVRLVKMSELNDLYQEVILDHNKNPRNFREIADVDEVAADDPLKIQFNNLHEYSVWILMAGMGAALLAFFIISNKKLGTVSKTTTTDPFDFTKEFKK